MMKDENMYTSPELLKNASIDSAQVLYHSNAGIMGMCWACGCITRRSQWMRIVLRADETTQQLDICYQDNHRCLNILYEAVNRMQCGVPRMNDLSPLTSRNVKLIKLAELATWAVHADAAFIELPPHDVVRDAIEYAKTLFNGGSQRDTARVLIQVAEAYLRFIEDLTS